MKLSGLQVLILGLGESGLAMARWCARQGARIRVADTRELPPGLTQLRIAVPEATFIAGPFDKTLLEGIDVLTLSPGLSAGQMLIFEARARGIPVLGEIELFAHALRELGVREQAQRGEDTDDDEQRRADDDEQQQDGADDHLASSSSNSGSAGGVGSTPVA